MIDGAAVLAEIAVRLSGYNEIVVGGKGPEGIDKDIQPFVVAYKPEEQKIMPFARKPQALFGLGPVDPAPEVGVERVGENLARHGGLEGMQVGGHFVAHADAGFDAAQEPFGERLVKEMLLVRDNVVRYGKHLAAGFSGNAAQRRSEPRHPVAYYQ